MIDKISAMHLPDWLSGDSFTFSLPSILKDSLYYPCCCFDGDPVKYFMGNVYSFVYVDYGVSREQFLNEIKENGFRGYHLIHEKEIKVEQLAPTGWKIFVEPNEDDRLNFENLDRQFIK